MMQGPCLHSLALTNRTANPTASGSVVAVPPASPPKETIPRVTGPAGAEPPPVVAYIDLTRGRFKPGLYAKGPVCLQLPRDFQLVQDPPPSADFQLTAIPPGPNIRTELGTGLPAE
jgi:hypothetical protein